MNEQSGRAGSHQSNVPPPAVESINPNTGKSDAPKTPAQVTHASRPSGPAGTHHQEHGEHKVDRHPAPKKTKGAPHHSR